MTYEELKELIRQRVYENEEGDITGQILQEVLISMIDTVDENSGAGGSIAPEYDVSASYVHGDVCIHDKVLYRCISDTTGDWDEGSWEEVTAAGLIAEKQDNLTFDDAPTSGSDNPVKSGGVKSALDAKQDNLTFDDMPTPESDNPVKSGGVFNVINALASGAKVSLSVSPSVIYRGESQSITLTATMSNATTTSLTIKDGGTTLVTGTTSPQTHTMSVTQTSASHTYSVTGVTLGVTLNGSVSLSAYYPIYYGFAANAAGVAVAGNKYAATNLAKHTYTRTASVDGQHFYILVPAGITNPTTFSMGGAPFVMTQSSTTIEGISYTVFASGNVYNSGTDVSVTAS